MWDRKPLYKTIVFLQNNDKTSVLENQMKETLPSENQMKETLPLVIATEVRAQKYPRTFMGTNTYNGEREASARNGAGKIGKPHAKA